MSVALVIQHAMRKRHSVTCGLPTLQYFFTISYKRHDFQETNLLSRKCVFLFSLQHLSETFLTLRRNERDMIKNAHLLPYKVPPFFLLALQPPLGVEFYSPLAGFSLLAYEVS